jgi:hypothetical protein
LQAESNNWDAKTARNPRILNGGVSPQPACAAHRLPEGIEEILDRHANLKAAQSIYRARVAQYPGRLIMLCDHTRVLARSDRPKPR